MNDTIARLRYAPDTAVVEIALGIVELLGDVLLAVHGGLIDELPPASHERRLALRLVRAAERLTRDGHRYLDYTREIASPTAASTESRQLQMF